MSDKKIKDNLLESALLEDLGNGDVTGCATIKPDAMGEAKILARQEGVLAGEITATQIFSLQDPELLIRQHKKEGERLIAGEAVMTIEGRIQSIVSAERTALNFLGHLSGIATMTFQFVDKIKDLDVRITDTRKTTPLWRLLEKKAVKAGGGMNHRMGLYDMILIKENHIEAAGGISNAVEKSRSFLLQNDSDLKIEVETKTLEEVSEAVNSNVDRIMLDNMTNEMMRKAVNIVAGRVDVEASGGVTLDTIREIAETGVNYISVGALTHSAPVFDYTLLLNSNI